MTDIKPHVWPELTEPKFGKWYPIDTAPKDGTVIIGRYNKEVFACRFWTQEAICEDEGSGRPEDYQAGWYDDAEIGRDVHPQTWARYPLDTSTRSTQIRG